MAVGPSTGADTKASAMDVEEDRELRGRRRCGFVEAELEIMEGVENDVFPSDRTVVVHRDVEAGLRRTTDGAVAVYTEDASAFVYFVGSSGGGRHGS